MAGRRHARTMPKLKVLVEVSATVASAWKGMQCLRERRVENKT